MSIRFFGRSVDNESEYGPHLRINLSNSNVKLSNSVSGKLFPPGTKVNFGFDYESDNPRAFIAADENKGFIVGENHTFSTTPNTKRVADALAKEGEGEVLILSVDLEPNDEILSEDGIKAYELELVDQYEYTKSKRSSKKSKAKVEA